MKPEDLTTWALDELSPKERQQIEAALKADEQTHADAQATRDFCDFLTDELGSTEETLTESQRIALLPSPEKAEPAVTKRSASPWWRRPGPATLAAAAAVTLMGGLSLMQEGQLSDPNIHDWAEHVTTASDEQEALRRDSIIESLENPVPVDTSRLARAPTPAQPQASSSPQSQAAGATRQKAMPSDSKTQFGLDLGMTPEVVEFDGFISAGNKIETDQMTSSLARTDGSESDIRRTQREVNELKDKYTGLFEATQKFQKTVQDAAPEEKAKTEQMAREAISVEKQLHEAQRRLAKQTSIADANAAIVTTQPQPVVPSAADSPQPAPITRTAGEIEAKPGIVTTSGSVRLEPTTGGTLAYTKDATVQPQTRALGRELEEKLSVGQQIQLTPVAGKETEALPKLLSDRLETLVEQDADRSSRNVAKSQQQMNPLWDNYKSTLKELEASKSKLQDPNATQEEIRQATFVVEAMTTELRSLELEIAESRAKERDEPRPQIAPPEPGNESYTPIHENPFKRVEREPLSTFSIDVDTASYANVRRFLNDGQRPPADAVRIEELVNYFRYDYEQPEGDAPFSVNVDIAEAPWNATHRLVRIGLMGREILDDRQPGNFVFLVDVSGSMNSPDKLELVQKSLRLLTRQLSDDDRVAIVTYAGNSGLALESTAGADIHKIMGAVDRMKSGGSTHGSAGIRLAYEQAVENFIEGGVNRVILCTDGDFNVGISDPAELEKVIAQNAKSGVFLSVLGFGTGNLKDRTMETLADKGNGNYAYIDSLSEARKVLVEQMNATLVTIAKDVKIQVEFNPAKVQSYRLIGYENRMLAKEDFNDDTKDAGEIGAGHTVTALYELVPVGVTLPDGRPVVDDLKYQAPAVPVAQPVAGPASSETLTVKLRYKQPDGDKSQLMEVPVTDEEKTMAAAPRDFKFATAVAGFGLLLRNSAHKGELTWDQVRKLASQGKGPDKLGYRGEFLQLIDKAQGASER